jgi:hypothetical protein
VVDRLTEESLLVRQGGGQRLALASQCVQTGKEIGNGAAALIDAPAAEADQAGQRIAHAMS